jgi:hypothetical protein
MRGSNSLLMDACRGGQLEAVSWSIFVLKERLSSLSSSSSGLIRERYSSSLHCNTPLMTACAAGHVDIVFLLLHKLKADETATTASNKEILRRDAGDRNAFDWAAQYGHVEVMSLLVHYEPSVLTGYLQRRVLSSHSSTEQIHVDTWNLLKQWDLLRKLSIYDRENHGKNWMENLVFMVPCVSAAAFAIATMWTITWILRDNGSKTKAYFALFAQIVLYTLIYFARTVNPGYIVTEDKKQQHIEYNNALQMFYAQLEQHSHELYSMTNLQEKKAAEISQSLSSLSETELTLRNTVCHVCRRAHGTITKEGHSKVTQKCIQGFDHNCVLLGVDIGQYNYPWFFRALLCIVTVTFPSFMSAAVHYVKHLEGKGGKEIKNPLPIISSSSNIVDINADNVSIELKFMRGFMVLTILVWLQMFFFLAFHIYCAYLGSTSREILIREKKKMKTTKTNSNDNYVQWVLNATISMWLTIKRVFISKIKFLYASIIRKSGQDEQNNEISNQNRNSDV